MMTFPFAAITLHVSHIFKRVVILTNKSKFFKKYDTYNPTGDTDNAEKKMNWL